MKPMPRKGLRRTLWELERFEGLSFNIGGQSLVTFVPGLDAGEGFLASDIERRIV